ncbi:MAG: hypothetical protein HY722_04615 [Planctomycetes bacterium]|nr:hypothetical protein [Planctomycetota bacterium]
MPRFVIQEHDHPAEGLHWDLMLERGAELATWRLATPPDSGPLAAIEARPLAAHRAAYLDYEGPVGGGRGSVRIWDRGDYEVERWDATEVAVRLSGQRLRALARLAAGRLVLALALLATGCAWATALVPLPVAWAAGDPSPPIAMSPSDEEVRAAVERGVAWLRARQEKSGAWLGTYSDAYASGPSALALYALLRAGVAPDDPAMEKGFTLLLSRPLEKTYSVSLAIMALAARYEPPRGLLHDADEGETTVRRRFFRRRVRPQDLRWLARAVQWLLERQEAGMWAYPQPNRDLSNTQFALLALGQARDLGVEVPPEPFAATVEYLLGAQQATGPEVPRFHVPAADHAIAELRKGEIRQRRREGGTVAPGEEDALHARGWGYVADQAPRGSMTAAALACMVIAKEALEARPDFQKAAAARVDQALRDGAAWLAREFRTDTNPGTSNDWLYYWLFSAQRAGALTGCDRFGRHWWYENGATAILENQRDDGCWEQTEGGAKAGPIPDTSFALLFLTRATRSTVVERPVTHGDRELGIEVEPAAEGRFRVRFRYVPGEIAPPERVSLAGSFNEWSADGLPMAWDAEAGCWEAVLELEAGRHTYKFVLAGPAAAGDDPRWVTDPSNPLLEDDGKGDFNSLLRLR